MDGTYRTSGDGPAEKGEILKKNKLRNPAAWGVAIETGHQFGTSAPNCLWQQGVPPFATRNKGRLVPSVVIVPMSVRPAFGSPSALTLVVSIPVGATIFFVR
jgi:hypothetical protein